MPPKSDQLHEISEGYTLDYLIPALFIFIIGIAGFTKNIGLGIVASSVLTPLAATLVCVKSGIDIDPVKKRARVYKALGKWKDGIWVDLSKFQRVELTATRISQVMRSRGTDKTFRTRTFDMKFIGEDQEDYEFHAFTDYLKARRTLAFLAKELGLSVSDKLYEAREEAMKRRKAERQFSRR